MTVDRHHIDMSETLKYVKLERKKKTDITE